MGRTVRLKYRIEANDTKGAWRTGWRGRATDRRLGEYCQSVDESMKVGGVNEHVSKSIGFIPIILGARIVNQDTGETVATYQRVAFQVF